jgi:hypothetical protein
MNVSGQLHAPAALPSGKEPLVPIVQETGWAQSRSQLGSEEKNSHPLLGLEPPIIQPVAQRYTTKLSRFLRINKTNFMSSMVIHDVMGLHATKVQCPLPEKLFIVNTNL